MRTNCDLLQRSIAFYNMDTFLWIISHFSCRLLVILLGIPDTICVLILHDEGKLVPYINTHIPLLVTLGTITLISSITLAVIGGRAGYDYVEMGRSRFWHYRNTSYSRGDSTFKNVLYWAGKMAMLPIVLVLLIILIVNIIMFLKTI